MPKYEFLVDTYSTERLKTLGVWSQIPDARMQFRPEPRARTPLEHMVHQCTSEDGWMKSMLGISVALPVLPASETRLAFLNHYAAASHERLASLSAKPESWFEETAQFFDVARSRAWILLSTVHAFGSPSWAVDLIPALVGSVPVLNLRPDCGYGRLADERSNGHLPLRFGETVARGGDARQCDAASSRARCGISDGTCGGYMKARVNAVPPVPREPRSGQVRPMDFMTPTATKLKRLLALSLVGMVIAPAFPRLAAQTPRPPMLVTADPACQSDQLVSTGGQFPKDRSTLAVRWTGYSNFELAYRGQVILLDAYFDRGGEYPPLGFSAADVRRANVILIGHGHYDHMSDAASVGIRTGATIVGASATIERLRAQAVDAKQLRTVTGLGGETLHFPGFTVEPVLARHGEPPAEVTAAFGRALQSTVKAPTAEQREEQAQIVARGSSDPRIVAEGTIAYVVTLDSGFRILYRDSGGSVTGYERAAAQRVGAVDLALVATSASYVTAQIVEQALEYVHTYKPSVVMPAHHDAPYNNLWRPTEPIFQAIKDDSPKIVTVSKGYREPTCFSTDKSTAGDR